MSPDTIPYSFFMYLIRGVDNASVNFRYPIMYSILSRLPMDISPTTYGLSLIAFSGHASLHEAHPWQSFSKTFTVFVPTNIAPNSHAFAHSPQYVQRLKSISGTGIENGILSLMSGFIKI